MIIVLPTAAPLTDNSDELGWSSHGNIPGVTGVTFCQIASVPGFDIENTSLQSIAMPNLRTIDSYGFQNGSLAIIGNAALTNFSAPVLAHISGALLVHGNSLGSLSLPALVTVGGSTAIDAGTVSLPELAVVGGSMTINSGTVSLPAWVPANNSVSVFPSLNSASVAGILRQAAGAPSYTSGTLNFTGASWPPTGSALTDYASVVAQGVTILPAI